MRWEDERYVRLYTRDSATWAMLPWQSRCLLPLLLRKVDRAGVLEVVAGEETAAVAELVRAPLEVVDVGLAGLQKRGVVVVAAGKLRLPAFLAAQEAKQSDKARQQKSRELASLAESMSHAVTGGHTASHDVTPSRAVPSRAVTKETSVAQARPDVARVFLHWKTATKKPKARLDQKRAQLIALRLNEGHAEADLTSAIDGYAKSEWHNGANDRHRKYLGLDLILRDAAHVDAGVEMAGDCGGQSKPKFLTKEEAAHLYDSPGAKTA